MSKLCDANFHKVIWFYGQWQELYTNLQQSVEFQQGLPNLDQFEGFKPCLIIIDDLMREANSDVVDIFTKGCHHRNLSVLFLTQNIFHQGKGQRDISLNAHYIICFKNPRDGAQIRHLARQINPANSAFVRESYEDATSKPHGYLLFDLKQATPDHVRYRTSIFQEDGACYAYIPKKEYKSKFADRFNLIKS